MPDEPLRTLIDGIRTRLHDELDVQLRAMSESHARDIEEARRAAHDEAERRWTAQLEAARLEWNTRLQAEVANVRSESERALIAETMRARVQAEQAAAESTSTARRELEESYGAERRRLEEQLAAERARAEAATSERDRMAAELEAERRKIAGADAEHQRQLAAMAQGHEREAADAQAERAQLATDRDRLAADRDRLTTERERLAAEHEALAAELDAHRRRIAELEAGQQQHTTALAADHGRVGELEAEIERLAAELAATKAALTLQPPGAGRDGRGAAVASGNGHEPEPRDARRLADALRDMDAAASLSDLLSACVRAAASAAPRAALFIVQGSELREWPVDGVRSVDSGPLRVEGREAGLIADALRRHEAVETTGTGGPAAPYFATLPHDAAAVAVPLVLGGTPVAVLYADQGTAGGANGSWTGDVQILGRHAGACATALTALRTTQAMRHIAEAPSATSASAGEDVEAARRYARLLVSEIKLYNEGAVRLGRERRDILARLEPEIDRARRLFDDRVPASVPDRHALFHRELSQTLADGDPALLGTARPSTS